ncbi:MAG: (deoxy)nucleoside triphosphate pyrophosphohydrolase [Clostridia bacterium]
MKKIFVAAGIIKFGDEHLCMQRSRGKYDYVSFKYEFPGGKLEEGETGKEALKRELFEEMEMNVEIGDLFMEVDHTYPDFEINMKIYSCKAKSKDFVMNVHAGSVWLKPEHMKELDWALADLPAVEKLIEENKKAV